MIGVYDSPSLSSLYAFSGSPFVVEATSMIVLLWCDQVTGNYENLCDEFNFPPKSALIRQNCLQRAKRYSPLWGGYRRDFMKAGADAVVRSDHAHCWLEPLPPLEDFHS